MLNKKIQNKTELRDEINFILKKHSLLNAHLESQLIISHSAKKSNYLNVKFDEINIATINYFQSKISLLLNHDLFLCIY